MITNLIIRCFLDVVSWIANLFPSWSTPDWVTSTASEINGFLANAASVGYWIPIPAIITGMTAVIGCGIVALNIRLARIAASAATGGGGSAG